MSSVIKVSLAVSLIALAAAAAWFDLRKDIIPNRLIFFGAGAGAALRIGVMISDRNPSDILFMITEVIVLFICLWPVYRVGGLGAGDCKLLLLAGVFLPVKQAVLVIISTFFIAAVEIILLLLLNRIKKRKRKITTIHFAPAFFGAVVIGWL